uniref:Uncharacterized protein n=1 Tax=Spironucleus salmonicida TaxID=348837 RepID=V6M434_9EUKA|eukprot:EST48084.1 Hypothetical protein SS50377_11782 [Spironucleus salmonicida]
MKLNNIFYAFLIHIYVFSVGRQHNNSKCCTFAYLVVLYSFTLILTHIIRQLSLFTRADIDRNQAYTLHSGNCIRAEFQAYQITKICSYRLFQFSSKCHRSLPITSQDIINISCLFKQQKSQKHLYRNLTTQFSSNFRLPRFGTTVYAVHESDHLEGNFYHILALLYINIAVIRKITSR